MPKFRPSDILHTKFIPQRIVPLIDWHKAGANIAVNEGSYYYSIDEVGDKLEIANSSKLNFGIRDFTIGGDFLLIAGVQSLISKYKDGIGYAVITDGSKITAYINDTVIDFTGIPLTEGMHSVYVSFYDRDKNTAYAKCWLDGVQYGELGVITVENGVSVDNTNPVRLGSTDDMPSVGGGVKTFRIINRGITDEDAWLYFLGGVPADRYVDDLDKIINSGDSDFESPITWQGFGNHLILASPESKKSGLYSGKIRASNSGDNDNFVHLPYTSFNSKKAQDYSLEFWYLPLDTINMVIKIGEKTKTIAMQGSGLVDENGDAIIDMEGGILDSDNVYKNVTMNFEGDDIDPDLPIKIYLENMGTVYMDNVSIKALGMMVELTELSTGVAVWTDLSGNLLHAVNTDCDRVGLKIETMSKWDSMVNESDSLIQPLKIKQPVVIRKGEFSNNKVIVFDGLDDILVSSETANWGSNADKLFIVFSIEEFLPSDSPIFGNDIIKIDNLGTLYFKGIDTGIVVYEREIILLELLNIGVDNVTELTVNGVGTIQEQTTDLVSVISTIGGDGVNFAKINLAEIIMGEIGNQQSDILTIREYLNNKYKIGL